MSKSEELVREFKHLLSISWMYLDRAKELSGERRTYAAIWKDFEKGRKSSGLNRILRLSADLDSAAIRLCSLDERVNNRQVHAQAYRTWSAKNFMHVYLRDAAGHAEDPGHWKVEIRRKRLGPIQLKDSYRYLSSIHDQLQMLGLANYPDLGDLTEWLQRKGWRLSCSE